MERLMFDGIYKDKTVLVTGHTGFKGSWLTLWLNFLGANVVGYSLNFPSEPNHYSQLNLNINSIFGDIRDRKKLSDVIKKYKPEIVFHLAAQPLVRRSYIDPYETFETNVMGTLNLYECCKKTESVKAIVNVTSDKCYENKEWFWGYRENDRLGGFDPYSASKACSEILTTSYRNSFFNLVDYGKKHNTLIASVRAGNVIGGGDWGEDRLIPDLIKAVNKKKITIIRNPQAIRPWQFVLEPLSGYLLLGKMLLQGKKEYADAWNFGPKDDDCKNVNYVVSKAKSIWNKINYQIKEEKSSFHEAKYLKLDCSKAKNLLGWSPLWGLEDALRSTIDWYKNFYEKNSVKSLENLLKYIESAKEKKVGWL